MTIIISNALVNVTTIIHVAKILTNKINKISNII